MVHRRRFHCQKKVFHPAKIELVAVPSFSTANSGANIIARSCAAESTTGPAAAKSSTTRIAVTPEATT